MAALQGRWRPSQPGEELRRAGCERSQESGVQKWKDCGPLATVTSDSDKISRKIRDSVLSLGQAEAFQTIDAGWWDYNGD